MKTFRWQRRISGNRKEKKTEMKDGKTKEKIWTLYENLKTESCFNKD